MRRLLTVWLALMLAAMALGACGGGDDEGAEGAQAAVATDDEGDAGSDGDDGSTDDEAANDDDDDADSRSAIGAFSAANCMEAIQAYSAGAASAAQAMSGDTKAMKASIVQMEKFVEEAPSEIRDELETMSKAWSEYVTAIADAGWDPTAGKAPTEAQAKKLEEAGSIFEEADYTDAQGKIDDWFGSDCGSR